ncbi:hypothetical protein HPG69_005670 [Diceros bicornis minor]|uniref:Uncharacterized protein n=1 Tax=Diceros bicornis minor TaxID=77932 RepID=A0A7J7ET55_DICBM|nr:hypothetical protein HPG69_005670 [Diceros bicornis minor]
MCFSRRLCNMSTHYCLTFISLAPCAQSHPLQNKIERRLMEAALPEFHCLTFSSGKQLFLESSIYPTLNRSSLLDVLPTPSCCSDLTRITALFLVVRELLLQIWLTTSTEPFLLPSRSQLKRGICWGVPFSLPLTMHYRYLQKRILFLILFQKFFILKSIVIRESAIFDNGGIELTWDPSRKWEMGALDQCLFPFCTFCCCPMESDQRESKIKENYRLKRITDLRKFDVELIRESSQQTRNTEKQGKNLAALENSENTTIFEIQQ